MLLERLMLPVLFSIVTGCASAGTGGTGSTAPTQITAAEIDAANVATAYDAVDRLARRWFRDLSGNVSGSVSVYLDTNQRLGGASALRDIPARDVALLRYLRSDDAVARFGSEASGGAIIVTRR